MKNNECPKTLSSQSFAEIRTATGAPCERLWFRIVIDFTQAIAKRLKVCGINRVELARRLDVSPSFITKVLKGDHNLSVETVAKLADAVECLAEITLTPKSLAGQAGYTSILNPKMEENAPFILAEANGALQGGPSRCSNVESLCCGERGLAQSIPVFTNSETAFAA